MASANPLPAYLDLDTAVTEANISGGNFIFAAPRTRRYIVPRLAEGDLGAPKMIDMGKELSFNTVLSARSTFQAYRYGASGAGINTNHLVKGRAPWTAARANKVYEDPEILLNGDVIMGQRIGGRKGDEIIAAAFAKVMDVKNATMNEDLINGWESQFWARPDKFNQEIGDLVAATSVPTPTPVMAMVNEEANGLWGGTLTTGETWTTKQGITPTTAEYGSNYKPQRQAYDNFTANNADNIIRAMDEMSKDLLWETPTKFGEYFQNDEMRKRMAITSRWGHTEIVALWRSSQSYFAISAVDPGIPDPQHLGIPITWNGSFGEGSYYPLNTTATGTETTADITGPRVLFLDGNNIKPCIHPLRFFEQAKPANDPIERPDVWIVWTSIWHQFMYPDLRQHGIVYPTTDITVPS
jgi:hypothetical protein